MNTTTTWNEFTSDTRLSKSPKVVFLNEEVKQRARQLHPGYYVATTKLMWEANKQYKAPGLMFEQTAEDRVIQWARQTPGVSAEQPVVITDVIHFNLTKEEANRRSDEKCLELICKNYKDVVRKGPELAEFGPHDPSTLIREAIQELRSDRSAARDKFSMWYTHFRDMEETHQALRAGAKTLVCAFCPRYRKTSWTLGLFLASQHDVLVVMSYVLSALTSYKKDTRRFDIFQDVVCVDTRDQDWKNTVQEALGAGLKVVILVSLHKNRECDMQQLAFVRNLNRMNVVDEADWGAWRTNQVKVVKYVSEGAPLLLETGGDDVRAAHHFKPDFHIETTYADLLVDKHNCPAVYTSELGYAYNPNMELPEPEFFILEWPDTNCSTLNPSFSKVAEDPAKAEGFITEVIGALLAGDSSVAEYLCLRHVLGRDPGHTQIWWPENIRIENLDKLAIMGQDIATACRANYKSVSVHGGVTTGDECQDYLGDLIDAAEKDGTRLLTHQGKMGARSCSEGRLSTCILAFDGGNAHQTKNKMARVLTTDYYNLAKVPAIVTISRDPTRHTPIDTIILEAAERYARRENCSLPEGVRIVLRSLRVKMVDSNGVCARVVVDDYTKRILTVRSLARMVSNKATKLQTIINDPYKVERLQSVFVDNASARVPPEQIKNLGKKFLDNKGRVRSNADNQASTENERRALNLLRKIEAAIEVITNYILVVSYMHPESNNVVDLLEAVSVDDDLNKIFINEMGVEPTFVLLLINDGDLDVRLIDLMLTRQRADDRERYNNVWGMV